MAGYDTNLASEFYVMAMLYRKGINANLTLGNKKSVDIVIEKKGEVITVDVKGLLAKNNAFPVDNWKKKDKNHYLIFVAFKDIKDHTLAPEVYIVPSLDLEKKYKELEKYTGGMLVYRNPKGNRQVVDLGRLRALGEKYKDKWSYFE